MTPERIIENQIFAYLKAHGIFCWKTDSVGLYNPTRKVFMKSHNPHRIKGVADIIGILPDGRMLAIEVKSPKGYPSKDQKEFIANITARGGLAFISRSLDTMIENMGDYLVKS